MGVVLGRNIFIYSGTTGTTPIIAAARSCTIVSKCDLIETASATQGTSKEYVPGRDEWDVSLDHLITTGTPFDGLLKVRQTYTISVVVNGVRKTGKVICQQADIKGAVGSLAKGSVSFKGSGPLT